MEIEMGKCWDWKATAFPRLSPTPHIFASLLSVENWEVAVVVVVVWRGSHCPSLTLLSTVTSHTRWIDRSVVNRMQINVYLLCFPWLSTSTTQPSQSRLHFYEYNIFGTQLFFVSPAFPSIIRTKYHSLYLSLSFWERERKWWCVECDSWDGKAIALSEVNSAQSRLDCGDILMYTIKICFQLWSSGLLWSGMEASGGRVQKWCWCGLWCGKRGEPAKQFSLNEKQCWRKMLRSASAKLAVLNIWR